MWAKVESGSVTEIYTRPKPITIGDVQYPRNIFELWSEAELKAIGIYIVEIDNTNLKDKEYYYNTNQTFNFASNKVTASYGSATAKNHADIKWTQQEIDDEEAPEGADTNTVKSPGLKTKLIKKLKAEAGNILSDTDWYATRKADAGTAIPSSITNHRAAVRTKCAEMETAITNASNTAALETLYTRNNEGVRPLGDLPRLES